MPHFYVMEDKEIIEMIEAGFCVMQQLERIDAGIYSGKWVVSFEGMVVAVQEDMRSAFKAAKERYEMLKQKGVFK